MFRWLGQLVLTPDLEHVEDKVRAAKVFHAVWLTLLVTISFFVLAIVFVFVKKTLAAAIAAILFIVLLISRALARRNRAPLAAAILISSIWCVFTVGIYLSGGLNTVFSGGYLVLTVAAGMILGRRAALLVAYVSLAACLGFALFETYGGHLPRYFPLPPISIFFLEFLLFCLAVPTIWLTLKELNESLIAAHREVQQRKKSEEALRESEERYRQLAQNSVTGIFVHQDGLFVYVNDRLADMLGYAPDEMLQKRVLDFVYPKDHQLIRKADIPRPHGPTSGSRFRFRAICKSGETTWLEVLYAPVVLGGRAAYMGNVVDITERKKMEDTIRDIVTGVSSEIGETFFSSTVEQFARILGADYTLVGKLVQKDTGQAVQTIAFYGDGAVQENFHYDLRGSPCERAIQEGICSYPSRVADEFPDDVILKTRHIDGLVCVGLYDSRGQPMGIMAAMYREPVSDIGFCESVLQIFAARTASEIERQRSEEALRSSESTLRSLLQAAPIGIGYVSQDRTLGWTNDFLCNMLGYTQEELFGQSARILYESDEEYLRVGREKHPDVIKYGAGSVETRFRRKDGVVFPVLLSSSSLVKGDLSQGLVFTAKDISERKRAEEESRLYTQKLEALIRIGQMSDAPLEELAAFAMEEAVKLTGSSIGYIAVVDEDESTLTIQTWSQEAERLCGIEDKPRVYPVAETGLWGEALRQRRPIITNDYGQPNPLKKGTPDGHLELLRHMNVPIFDEGRVVIVAGVGNKPTEYDDNDVRQLTLLMEGMWGIVRRRDAEQRLKRLGAAVESAGETIVVTDAAGSIIYVNPAFEEVTGYSREEALGKNPRILQSGKHDRSFYREMWDTLRAGRVWRGRFTNRRKDGTLYEETATIAPVRDERNRIVNYVAVKRDVTEEVTLQKQLLHSQKMEAIGTLAGGIAHDINNLLQAILGYSDLLLLSKESSDPDRKKLEIIQHAARDGAELVARILTFSRKSEPKKRPIDLNEEIRRTVRLLRRTLPRMIRIDLTLSEGLRIIDADPAQIEQVILNLGVNAQHAMPDGGRLVIETTNLSLAGEELRKYPEAQPGEYVLLTFSDTGVGIPSDVLDRIFEPFFTTRTDGEGTGLGLAMVHGIVAQHGGFIRCLSQPGNGTSFKIYLPVSDREPAFDSTETRDMPAFGTETILLVDDDPPIREMAREMIAMGGYEVITAESGEEAIEIYQANREQISLIVLDLIMPGMGGKRCLEELLRVDPDVRVLVTSGHSRDGVMSDREGKGARGFVSKPYDAMDILGAIRTVLDKGYF